MMSKIFLLTCCILLCQMESFAQQRSKPEFIKFPQKCSNAEQRDLIFGDTLVVNCKEPVRVYSMLELRKLLGNDIKNDSIRSLLTERVQLSDSLRSVKDSIITAYKQMNALQNKFYADLRTIYTRTDSLARASTANTDAALNLVKKSQTASYITSSLAGGVAGGFIGGTLATGGAQVQFNLIGAIIGAAVGAGLNYLLLSLP